MYDNFIFKNYAFEPTAKTVTLTYGYDDAITFTETYLFDFDYTTYNPEALDRALQNLFFLAGVSYYKAYIPPTIIVQKGSIDAPMAKFLGRTYQEGLGEFFYVNKLDPHTQITFPITQETIQPVLHDGNGPLIGIGGGKDSLVSAEMLRDSESPATWSVGHRPQLTPLIERIGLPHYWVERDWDRQLIKLNEQGAYNGHIPISAILAAAGTVTAILSGKKDIVVSNEASASEPSLFYEGKWINHQYSKSLAFEKDYQAVLQHQFADSIRYFSLLRPYSELYISQLFAPYFDKYKDVFSSCNRAYVADSKHMYWCGNCAKCAFVFLALTPFIEQKKLEDLFGENLLLDSALVPMYKKLLGLEDEKPLDCVGEVAESRVAMGLALQQASYSSIKPLYNLEPTINYDYMKEHLDLIPKDIKKHLYLVNPD